MKTSHIAPKILTFLYKNPVIAVAIVLISTGISIYGLLNIKMESDTRKFLPQKTEIRKNNDFIDEIYNIESEIVVLYNSDGKLVTHPEIMKTVDEIVGQIDKLQMQNNEIEDIHQSEKNENQDILADFFSGEKSLSEPPSLKLVDKVQAITTLKLLEPDSEGFTQIDVSKSLPQNTEESLVLRERLAKWDVYKLRLFSNDFRYGTIIITPQSGLSTQQRQQLHKNIRSILDDYKDKNIEFHLSGEDIIQSVIGDFILSDLVRLLPLLIFMICAILYFFFKQLIAPLIILLPVGIALLNTLGLLGLLGIKFTFIHASIPVIIMALGSADAIHYLNHFKRLDSNKGILERLLETQQSLIQAISLTSLTTGIGFLSLSISIMHPVRSFGLFCAIGIGFAWFVNVFFTPLLIAIFASHLKSNEVYSVRKSRIGTLIIRINRTLLSYSPYVRIFLVAVFILLMMSIRFVKVNNDTIKYFHKNADIVQATTLFNQHMGGLYSLNISINGQAGDKGSMLNPEILQYMDGLADWVVSENPETVEKTLGLHSFLQEINRVLNPSSQFLSIPESRKKIAQYLAFYSDSLDNFAAPTVLEPSYGRLSFFLNNSTKETIEQVLKSIEKYRMEFLPTGYSQIEGGYSLTVNNMNSLVVKEQFISIAVALMGVLLLISLVFKSFKKGVLACLPPIGTLLVSFSLMAILKIDLNISTMMIASLIIGVGIDYSIHIISLNSQNTQVMGKTESMEKTLEQLGTGVLLNAVSVGMGYAVLLFSKFRSLAFFGQISSISSIVSAILALVIIPFLVLSRTSKDE